MADTRDEEQPEYTLYRSRPRLFGRRDGAEALSPAPSPQAPPKRRRIKISPGRVVAYLALALAGWLLISLILFLVSAQLEAAKVDARAKAALSPFIT
jgi:hypothetical protein